MITWSSTLRLAADLLGRRNALLLAAVAALLCALLAHSAIGATVSLFRSAPKAEVAAMIEIARLEARLIRRSP